MKPNRRSHFFNAINIALEPPATIRIGASIPDLRSGLG